ncbi:MAG: hypothetical protein LLF82_000320 [Dehalococcoides mccartyi]|uniref:hypothetical protein n=1 Tax=Dehalococcoides mccartyi TaxID=61435 RepID=UPI00242A5E98|nr:hypothetical protein [Dehalococcoides mccartyi]MCF7634854.1 hypothetical protein [Dehalococcoides mccartyi]
MPLGNDGSWIIPDFSQVQVRNQEDVKTPELEDPAKTTTSGYIPPERKPDGWNLANFLKWDESKSERLGLFDWIGAIGGSLLSKWFNPDYSGETLQDYDLYRKALQSGEATENTLVQMPAWLRLVFLPGEFGPAIKALSVVGDEGWARAGDVFLAEMNKPMRITPSGLGEFSTGMIGVENVAIKPIQAVVTGAKAVKQGAKVVDDIVENIPFNRVDNVLTPEIKTSENGIQTVTKTADPIVQQTDKRLSEINLRLREIDTIPGNKTNPDMPRITNSVEYDGLVAEKIIRETVQSYGDNISGIRKSLQNTVSKNTHSSGTLEILKDIEQQLSEMELAGKGIEYLHIPKTTISKPSKMMSLLTTIEDYIKQDVHPVLEKLAKNPAVNAALRTLAPATSAVTPLTKGLYGWVKMKASAVSLSRLSINDFMSRKNPFKIINGKLTGVIAKDGKSIIDINAVAENPGKYWLTQEQWDYLDSLDEIYKSMVDVLKNEGVNFKPITLGKGERYIHRMLKDVNEAKAQLAATKAVIGGKGDAFKQRLIEDIADALKSGYVYETDLQFAVEMYMRSAYNLIADTRLTKYLKNLKADDGSFLARYVPDNTVIKADEALIEHAGMKHYVMPIDHARVVNDVIHGQTSANQFLEWATNLTSVVRMINTGLDTGWSMIQGLLLVWYKPVVWAKGFSAGMHHLGNPENMKSWMSLPEHKQAMIEMSQHGGVPIASTEVTEASHAVNAIGKNKVLNRLSGAYETYIDISRTLLYENERDMLVAKLGRKLTEKETAELVTTCDHICGVSDFVRLGYTKDQRAGLSLLSYAPRYYASAFGLIAKGFQRGESGKIARNCIGRMAIGMPALMSAIAISLGQEDRLVWQNGKPPKMFDPTQSEFMTVEVGGSHIGFGSIWCSLIKTLAVLTDTSLNDPEQLASPDVRENPLLKFFYGHTSPAISTVIDFATGRDYLGNVLFTGKDEIGRPKMRLIDLLSYGAGKVLPFWMREPVTDIISGENVWDVLRGVGGSDGEPNQTWADGIANWFGFRTYGVQYSEQAEDFASKHLDEIPDNLLLDWQKEKKKAGTFTYADLNMEQEGWLYGQYAEYADLYEKAALQKLKRGTDYDFIDRFVSEKLDAIYHDGLKDLVSKLTSGEITLEDYMKVSDKLRTDRYSNSWYNELLANYMPKDKEAALQEWLEKRAAPEEKALNQYYEIRSKLTYLENGNVDWDDWNKRQEDFLSQLTPDIRAYITRQEDNFIDSLPGIVQPIERLIFTAKTKVKEYYDQKNAIEKDKYLVANPEVDALLLILGRHSTARSSKALENAIRMLKNVGLDTGWVSKVRIYTPSYRAVSYRDLLKRQTLSNSYLQNSLFYHNLQNNKTNENEVNWQDVLAQIK